MKFKFIHTLALVLALFSYSLTAFNQVTIKATIDKNKIVIGEQVLLQLQVSVPQNNLIRFFEIDTIPHFEFIDKKKIDTVNTRQGTILTQQMVITSFDSGSFVIPSFILDSEAGLKTDSLPIDVGFAPFDRNADYNDIKDVKEVELPDPPNNNWMYIAGAALLVLIIILLIVFRKKKKPMLAAIPGLSAYDNAMQQLQHLKKQNPPDKLFYTALTEIFREYIFIKKGIQSTQPTTEELVLQLKDNGLPTDQFLQLSQSLRLSDFVKFAKYKPVLQENDLAFNTVKNSIETIEKQSPKNTDAVRLD